MTEEFRQEIRRQAWVEMCAIQMDAFRAIVLTHQSLQAIAQQVTEEKRRMAQEKRTLWGYPSQWYDVTRPSRAATPLSHPPRT